MSLRSAGVAPEAILAGVINAMARRSANFIARLSCEAPICLLVALATVKGLPTVESHLGMPVQTHPDAQFAGAIGAAVIGQRQRNAHERVCVFISLHGRRHTNPQGVAGSGHDFSR
ncbi:BadF/BadG/BcrA/BcrD ATPase family protein [Shigella sonnei]